MANPNAPRQFPVEYDPALVEETVLLQMSGDREETQFRRVRDRIYELEEGEAREKRFREFHAEWFVHLKLGRPVSESLREQPVLLQSTRRCCVFPARTASQEGADLHGLRDAKPGETAPDKVIVIRLEPRRLLDASATRGWLRHELMHVADMLDPRFGYQSSIPTSDGAPAFTNLLRDRYRVLWDIWIDGRLARRGWLPDGARERRLEEFCGIFSAFGSEAEAKFQEIFDSDFQTHAALLTFASNLRIPTDAVKTSQSRPQPCPLCRFPTYRLLDGQLDLTEELREQIRSDVPGWQPEQGLCVQCADLYRARELSQSAEATLPRI